MELAARAAMAAAEAHAAAAAEGLALVRSENPTQQGCVPQQHCKPFRAELRPGRNNYLGFFVTAVNVHTEYHGVP